MLTKKRKGIVLAGGTGSRLFPLTISVSKQLMPVYDKPMIYYPISVLMLGNMRDILLISSPEDQGNFVKLLGDGSQWGIKIEYATQAKPEGLAQALIIAEDFLDGSPSCLALGDNLFYGANFARAVREASENEKKGAVIFGYFTAEPQEYGVIEFDKNNKAVSLEEKPAVPKSNYAVPGLYFYDEKAPAYAKDLKPSDRGELEITDLNLEYLNRGNLKVIKLGRGVAWLDTGNPDSLSDASDFVRAIQHRQGLKIACLEEIAYIQKWISKEQLNTQAENLGKNLYSEYLLELSKYHL